MNTKLLAVCLIIFAYGSSHANDCFINISEGVTLEKVTCSNGKVIQQKKADNHNNNYVPKKQNVVIVKLPERQDTSSSEPKIVRKYNLGQGSNIMKEMGLTGLPWNSVANEVSKVLDDLEIEDQTKLPVGFTWCLLDNGRYTKCK